MKPQKTLILTLLVLVACAPKPKQEEKTTKLYTDRPPVEERAFVSPAVDAATEAIAAQITHPKLQEMFRKCFPNTLDTTVHYAEDEDGRPDTYVYTGDIPAMWLRDSGAQVWPYLAFVNEDDALRKMIAGVINRQFKCILIDPYANAFNVDPIGPADDTDLPKPGPYVFERKWEIDSQCYPVRLAYAYWQKTGDTSIFGDLWMKTAKTILATFKEQQRKEGHGSYTFLRVTDRQLDTKCVVGRGNPVKPVGLNLRVPRAFQLHGGHHLAEDGGNPLDRERRERDGHGMPGPLRRSLRRPAAVRHRGPSQVREDLRL